MLGIVLLVAAFVLFILASIPWKEPPAVARFNLGWAGMACIAAYWLFVAHAGGPLH